MANEKKTKEQSNGRDYNKKYDHSGNKPRCKFIDGRNFHTNDYGYYNKYLKDLESAANVYWNQTMGAPLHMGKYTNTDIYSENGDTSLPGIMCVRFQYGPGYASSFDDAVNRTFTQLMNDLYSKTAASELPFTKASVAMLFTSVASIANNLELVRKRMLTTKLWATRNINYPKAVLNAMGTSLEHEMEFYNQNMIEFNNLVRMFNKLEVPAFLDVYKRQMGLCANIWTDEDDVFSQIYMFEPTGYYRYDDTQNKATWVEFSADPFTLSGVRGSSELLQIIKNQLHRWYTTNDLNLIRSSFYRAYGQYEALQLSELSNDDTLTFKGDQVIMNQIMNCDIVNGVINLDITEDVVADEIKWQPGVSLNVGSPMYSGYLISDTRLLRLFKDNPTKEDLVECTRLKCVPGIGGDNFLPLLPNPEIVSSIEIYSNATSSADPTELHSVKDVIYRNVYVDRAVANAPGAFVKASTFRYIPTLICLGMYTNDDYTLNQSQNIMTSSLIGDVYNYTDISKFQLENLNRVCLLSMYKVDLRAKG